MLAGASTAHNTRSLVIRHVIHIRIVIHAPLRIKCTECIYCFIMGRHAAIQKRQVWEGTLAQTDSGLRKKDLCVSKSGQIVSKRKRAIGKAQLAWLKREGLDAPKFKRSCRRSPRRSARRSAKRSARRRSR